MSQVSERMRVRPLLEEVGPDGTVQTIDSAEGWEKKRERLRSTIVQYLGEAPDLPEMEPKFHVYEEHERPEFRQLLIGYEVEPGEEVKAHLLIPPKEKRRKGATVLCLHGTSDAAKDTQLNIGAKPGRDYGLLMARNGFVVLAPDHVCSGERQPEGLRPYDTTPFYERYPRWSATGKGIWDGMRAIDILTQLDEVDPERIGSVGHSLGGYSSIFLAAFDERVKTTVSSCGLTSWQDNPKRLDFARDRWYIHFPLLREPFKQNEIPFDMHEFAALIAPRPFLNISGMTDYMYAFSNENMPEIGYQLSELYKLLGHPDHFANFLMGADHNVPPYSQALTLAWMEHWLLAE